MLNMYLCYHFIEKTFQYIAFFSPSMWLTYSLSVSIALSASSSLSEPLSLSISSFLYVSQDLTQSTVLLCQNNALGGVTNHYNSKLVVCVGVCSYLLR